jgi:hypothetical protein
MSDDPPDDEAPLKKARPKWLDANYDRYKRSQKHEERLATKLGGRRLPQSGAKRLSKYALRAQTGSDRPETITLNGDLTIGDFWVEHKRTETETMSIKKEWWLKVREGAAAADQEPALFITFETPHKPKSKPIDLVVIPLEVFERLRKIAKGD